MNIVHLSGVLPGRRASAWPGHKENTDVTATTSREQPGESRTDGTLPGPRSAPPGGRTVVSLHDGLDLAAAPALRERLIDVLRRSADLLILDLSHVPSCDAAGLAVLIGTQRRARLRGITMRLVAPSLPVRKVMRSTGLDRSFTICPDLSKAAA
jgi:anti-sigma B factor antagonist